VQTATADPLVGHVIDGRYRIETRIARGGMSTVYRAVDLRLERRVAVKVMSGMLSADPAFTDRFAREARSAARMAHINAVSVYDHGTQRTAAGDLVFLVMEFVNGRTLRDLLRERGRLSPAEAVSVMEPVLAALAVAHRAGLVHRDVKPENILLSDDGVVKVADFGLVRAVEAEVASTRTGLMMGTVAYCSPEHVTRGATDQRSDVYSAGVVLFELLTGQTPFLGDTAMAVAYQHVHSRVPAPSSRVRGLPEELDDLVIRATDSDPAGRPTDAGDFLAELHDVRAALNLPVMPVPPRPRLNGHVPSGTHQPSRPDLQRTTDFLGERSLRHDTLAQPSTTAPPPARPEASAPAHRPDRARRRHLRRVLIGWILLLLLGAASGYAGWWFASGRYQSIPNIVGEPRSTAVSALRNAGFGHIAVQNEFSETIAKDVAIRTDPQAGSHRLPTQNVTLVVSSGKERYTVPDVRNRSQQVATATLASRVPGVQVVVVPQPSDTVTKDAVIATDPPAGTAARRGQVLRLLLSSGPPIVTVPEVTGQAQDVATTTLTEVGFKVSMSTDFSDSLPEGAVISQQPSGSSQLAKFSTVTIVVSQGPHFVTVPSVGGLSADDARAKLETAGFKVKVKEVYGGHLDITVGLDVDRNDQGKARYGSTVTIEVA
jgi:serine/threonine protein kinase